jgi:hypothetical protein
MLNILIYNLIVFFHSGYGQFMLCLPKILAVWREKERLGYLRYRDQVGPHAPVPISLLGVRE